MEHKFNSTKRFSGKVENYIRYRPSYPVELIGFLVTEGMLNNNSIVADIGSGTGISSQLFLKNGNTVYGIEPNKEMREAGEKLLVEFPNFKSRDAVAENTGMKDHSVDLIIAGQAFHWFDVPKCRIEFDRILSDGGSIALIWNDRKTDAGEFLLQYDLLLNRYCIDYAEVNHKNTDDKIFDSFFGKDKWKMKVFPNFQEFDLEGLKGRLHSSSYVPAPGHANYEPLMKEMELLFKKYNDAGKVRLEYDTKIYFGKIS